MMVARKEVLDKLWFGQDPFLSFPRDVYAADQQGWNNDHPLLIKAVEMVDPTVIAEIGVWKGRSIITIARKMREMHKQGVILAIDTWLGASEHWFDRNYFNSLRFEAGYPKLYHCFMQNMIEEGVQDLVVPLPVDSVNASVILSARGIELDLLHIDGAHDYRSVAADLAAWWPLLRPGGAIVCDDYVSDGSVWEGLKRAVDEFVVQHNINDFEAHFPKCILRKPL